ncbi:hypothetical protein [Dongia sp.]|uniref:hypothetical protein n=1 Tax=Dongia sp. TaxID=1977262 RepID=UPI003753CF9F
MAMLTAICGPARSEDDLHRLTGAEIKARIYDHEGGGSYAPTYDPDRVRVVTYFSPAGKVLIQQYKGRSPAAVSTAVFELKEDRLCFHDLGLMNADRPDRCFAAYAKMKGDEVLTTYLLDEQDKRTGIPLDSLRQLVPGAAYQRWARWEVLRQDSGPIDGFGSMDEISRNPFRFKGKVLLVAGRFLQMIGEHRGLFESRPGYQQFVVDGISTDWFRSEDDAAIFVGKFSGSLRMTQEGSDRFLPIMTAKAARLCQEKSCADFVEDWR